MEFVQSITPRRVIDNTVYRERPTRVFDIEDTMTKWNNLFVYGFVSKVEYDLMRAWKMYQAVTGNGGKRGN